jgi:hypothetical protein
MKSPPSANVSKASKVNWQTDSMNPTVRLFAITYDPHDLHGCLPAADVANSLGEGSLVDEAELEGVAAHLDEVVEEGAEAGQRVRRAKQGHVPELERSATAQNIIAIGVPWYKRILCPFHKI